VRIEKVQLSSLAHSRSGCGRFYFGNLNESRCFQDSHLHMAFGDVSDRGGLAHESSIGVLVAGEKTTAARRVYSRDRL